MNITTNIASKLVMREVLQDEINIYKRMLEDSSIRAGVWSKTIASVVRRDVKLAEKAIADKDDAAMFRTLRSLRQYNLL